MSSRSRLVQTQYGQVEGVPLEAGVAWRGIPYAKPPVGERRHKPPEPPAPWSDVRQADKPGNPAPQEPDRPAGVLFDIFGETPSGGAPVSEDCLYINVSSPGADGQRRPVLVWIHGGGFHYGSGADDRVRDGLGLVEHDIVVVSFNYRLGVFGFLYLGELLGEEYAASGNCGILDQIAALRWVRDNIEAFGGDPDRVTIAGVSAGGKSVAALMSSPLASGLFQRAVSVSGGGEHVVTPDRATTQASRLLQLLGVEEGRPEGVLERSMGQLLEADLALAEGTKATFLWRPVIDGSVLTGVPRERIAAGASKGIPLLAGTVIHESLLYDYSEPTALDQSRRVLDEIFGSEQAEQVLEAYAASNSGGSDGAALAAVMSDERYGIPTIRLLDAQSDHAPVWRYRADFKPPSFGPLAGCHGGDICMWWGSGAGEPSTPLGRHPEYVELSAKMRSALAAFVRDGEPAAPGLPDWPTYDRDTRATMLLDLESKVVDDPDGSVREAWGSTTWTSSTWWVVEGVPS